MASYFKMDGMVNKAIKGAAVGAGVCLAYWVGKQLLPTRQEKPFDLVNARANEALCCDSEVRALCGRLAAYKYLDEVQFTHLLVAWAQMITLYVKLTRNEVEVQMGMTRRIADYGGTVVEAVRTLRAKVAMRNPASLRDFDEIAADMQRKVNEYRYNTTKTIEHKQAK